MSGQEIIVLKRDVEARLVPSGAIIQLPRYTEVTITQTLGGTYTVNLYGNLARIEAKDADALGKAVVDPLKDVDVENASFEDIVWAYLKTCYDPEIPVNIVDLGLIYNCELLPLGADDYAANLTMTLTAPGCGMGPVIADDVKQKLLSVEKIKEASVEIVFDPPWDRSMISAAAKLQLGVF